MKSVGLIGLGAMGARHMAAYALLGMRVTHLCDLRAEAASLVPDARFATDYRDLLFADPPEVLSVATTADSHRDIVIAAVEAGVQRVLCEKPIATSVADAQEITEHCRSRGVHLVVNHSRRWHPAYVALRALLADDATPFGALCHFSVAGGCAGLSNLGTHYLDLAEFLVGAPVESVCAWLDSTGTPNPRGARFCDPGGAMMFTFAAPSSARGFIDFEERSGVGPVITILAETGRITIDEVTNKWVLLARRPEDRHAPRTRYGLVLEPVSFENPPELDVVQLTASVIAHLLAERTPDYRQGESAVRALEAVIAAHRSHALGGVPVPRAASGAERLQSYAFS